MAIWEGQEKYRKIKFWRGDISMVNLAHNGPVYKVREIFFFFADII